MSRFLILVGLPGLVVAACTTPCKDGEVDCGCLSGDRCNAELVCVLGVCVEPGDVCGDGILGAGEECDGGAVVNGACDSTCRLSCNLGFDDCNGVARDGCETDLRTTLAHCGACGDLCDATGGSASCAGGNCTLVCDVGFADCNDEVGDGCEVILASDPASCGSCGHDCLGGGCAAGQCLPLVVATDPEPQDVEVDAEFIYFTSRGSSDLGYADGAVIRVTKTTRARTVLAQPHKEPTWLALDGTDVYWASLGSSPYLDGAILVVPRAGGEVRTLASGQEFPGGLAVDESHVYWTTSSIAGGVGRIAKDGVGGISWLATAQSTPGAVVVDATTVYWTNRYGTPSGAVMAVPLAGSGPAPFVSDQEAPYHLAQDAAALYWVNWDTNRLMTAPKATGVASQVVQEQGRVTGVAVDATTIYWGLDRGRGASAVRARAKSGGDVIDLAAGIDPPGAIAVDATAIYWTAAAGVVRLAR